MTQSIITRYHGATNTKPGRVSATASSKCKRYYYNIDFYSQIAAAREFGKSMGWRGKWHGGALNDKGDMVWVNTSDKLAKNYQFEV